MKKQRLTADEMPESEAELCDALAHVAPLDGWDVFPEVGGFDLVLVRNGTRPCGTARSYSGLTIPAVERGYQLGIDAKLRANVEVLEQCAGRMDLAARPDAAAVLVPEASLDFIRVAARLGLRVLTLEHCRDRHLTHYGRPWAVDRIGIEPISLRTISRLREGQRQPLELPPVALQGSGGKASPRALTSWRVRALRVCLALKEKGSLTRADAKPHGIDLAHWAQRGWLVTDGKRPATYRLPEGRTKPAPVVGYEREFEALAAAEATRGVA